MSSTKVSHDKAYSTFIFQSIWVDRLKFSQLTFLLYEKKLIILNIKSIHFSRPAAADMVYNTPGTV